MTRLHRLLLACALALLSGCSNVPVEEQVRAQLTKAQNFKELSLRETADGSFVGTGKTADGSAWDVEVKYYPNSKLSMWYKVKRPGGSATWWGNISIR